MGFYTEITFNSVEGMFTLPLPYSGVLGPGQKAILADPPATVEANFGGKVPPVVTLTQVPDTTTPSTQSALPAAVYDLNPTQDFAIYAAVDGNDANSGLASNMAVETAIKAFSLVPPNRQSSSLKMYFGAGHFPIDCTNLRPIIFGPLSGPGPAGAISPSTQYNPFLEIIGTYQDVGLGVRTTTSPSDGTSVTDTGLSMTVDAYFGYTVRCTQGANAGQRRGIKYNTATTLDLDTPFFNTVSAGDQFVVEQPGTFFDCVGAPVFTSFGRYIMKGIQINVTPDANGNQFLAFGGGQGGGIVMLNGVIINSGTCLIPFATSAQALPLPLGSEVLDQTGVTFQNTYVVIGTDSGAGACLGGTVISDGSTLDAEGESLLDLYTYNGRASSIDLDSSNLVLVSYTQYSGGPTIGSLRSNGATQSGGIAGGHGANLLVDGIELDGCSNYAVAAFDSANVNVAPYTAVLGTDNAGGVYLDSMSNGILNSGATVTGANDTQIDGVNYSYTSLAGAADTAAVGSTTTAINLTAGGLSPGAFVGLQVQVNGLESRQIIANTANTITVGVPFATAPDSTTPIVVLSGYTGVRGSRIQPA